jgi:RsmE family RNA methyltransferase
MNRILFEASEIDDDIAVCDGARARHIVSVLRAEVGKTLKIGRIDGPVGEGTVVSIDDGRVRVRTVWTGEALRPWVDLVLAPPRPRVLKRLLPQLAAMGVGRVFLVGAAKVEKDFWGATLLKEEIYRPLLIDGLMQAGTTALPELHVRRAFRRFVADELDAVLPSRRRLVAHPAASRTPVAAATAGERPVLAVGPEGGWLDSEVALLEERGFSRWSLGPRVLRTDTALIALLARLDGCA